MPSLLEKIFDICENYMLSGQLAKEFHYLLLNLVNINDDDIQDQLLESGIIRCFLCLVGDIRYGPSLTVDVLETFQLFLESFQSDQSDLERMAEI